MKYFFLFSFILVIPTVLSIVAEWGPWDEWFSSDYCYCNAGKDIRVRSCMKGKLLYPDFGCNGSFHSASEVRQCHLEEKCYGKWASWGEWSSTTCTCPYDNDRRERQCEKNGEVIRNSKCRNGSDYELRECKMPDSCHDGDWTEWSEWSSTRCNCVDKNDYKFRICIKNGAVVENFRCNGSDIQKRPCNFTSDCLGEWTEWGEWSSNECRCYGWRDVQLRKCKQNGAVVENFRCNGSFFKRRQCNFTSDCLGEWTEWGEWSSNECRCYTGGDIQRRQCKNNGTVVKRSRCNGSYYKTRPCNLTGDCLAQWTAWDSWSMCKGSCSYAVKTKTRTCMRNKAYTYIRECGDSAGAKEEARCPISGCNDNHTVKMYYYLQGVFPLNLTGNQNTVEEYLMADNEIRQHLYFHDKPFRLLYTKKNNITYYYFKKCDHYAYKCDDYFISADGDILKATKRENEELAILMTYNTDENNLIIFTSAERGQQFPIRKDVLLSKTNDKYYLVMFIHN